MKKCAKLHKYFEIYFLAIYLKQKKQLEPTLKFH